MGLADEAKKAEELAKQHPDQVDKAVQQGEKQVQERTGHSHDQQISEGGEQIEKRLGAGQQEGQQQGQQPSQPQDPQEASNADAAAGQQGS